MDDKIIYSWCFNLVENFDSTSFGAIIVLIETLESFLSLKSQQVEDLILTKNINFEDFMSYPMYDVLEILWLGIYKS